MRDQLDDLRRSEAPELQRVVVAIDPSGSGGEEADGCGIVAAGVDEDDTCWVLADASGRWQPTEWAKRAIDLYYRLKADRIVAETNFGGQMVEVTIRAIDLNVAYRAVTASRGKAARAEPVSALYEQRRVHHVGTFPELEDQMCAFTSPFDRAQAGFSPGRVDALVWALTELVLQPMAGWGLYELTRRQALGLPIGRSDTPTPPKPVVRGRWLTRCWVRLQAPPGLGSVQTFSGRHLNVDPDGTVEMSDEDAEFLINAGWIKLSERPM
jgi:hypothetical protein